ncbi:hypothetical protein [Thermococcus barophilus]|uniref:Uncharacterized protein n=1 Tax=Thermococcus barophilus TaxID=55802 RepID=A0A0S1X881_THEBA|nr:hypothetical protein [Thermococcus barophilus]ALM74003.1 hypothetical protein TBCH5v1_0023 [Thermococcus barophilus]
MRSEQVGENKAIPQEYLIEEQSRPKKGREKERKSPLEIGKELEQSDQHSKSEVILQQKSLRSSVAKLPQLSLLEEESGKASVQISLSCENTFAGLHYFGFPKIKVDSGFQNLLFKFSTSFDVLSVGTYGYPDLKIFPADIEILDIAGDLVRSKSTFFGAPLSAFPRICVSKSGSLRSLFAVEVPPTRGDRPYPSIVVKEEEPKGPLPDTALHPAEGTSPFPSLKPSPAPYVCLAFTGNVPEGKTASFPGIEVIGRIKVPAQSLSFEFNVVELLDNIEKFITGEVGKMEKEDLLLGILNIKGYLPRGASEAFDKPIFILLGQDMGEWHYPVAYLLSEIYKEIKGEKPGPTLRDFAEYLENIKNVDSIRDVYLMVAFKPWGKIEILDGRKVEISKIKSFLEKIKGRLKTAYLQGLGFFLIVVENNKVQDLEEMLGSINGIAKIVMLPEIPQSRAPRRYEALTYALLGMRGEDFLKVLEEYEERLKKTVRVLSPFVPKGTDEAQEHSFREAHQYPIKVAVLSYILDLELKKLDEPPTGYEFYKFIIDLMKSGKIKIESPIRIGEKTVIPDIIYEEGKAYIEIETLVGTEDPLKKIDETIHKYSQDNKLVLDDHELWIVLRPVSALIHYDEIVHRQRILRLLYDECPVKFKVLVYDRGWKLISLETFARNVKEALKETKELREKI